MKLKKVLRNSFWALDLLALGVGSFYWWAKSPTLSSDDYARLEQYPFPSPSAHGDTFKIISYNIGYLSGMTNNLNVRPSKKMYDRHLERAKKYFKEQDADIIALQEVDFDSKRSYRVNQHMELINHLQMGHGALAVNWDKQYVPFPYFPPSVHFGKMLSGQSILSKYPITFQDRIVLEEVKDRPFYYRQMYLSRLAQVTKLKLQEKEVILINVHTEAFIKETRYNQISYLHSLFKRYARDYPVLMVGDFNSDPAYEEAAIELFLSDKTIESAIPKEFAEDKEVLTYPSDAPYELLDFIFYNKDKIEPVGWEVLESFGQVSDHLPISFSFRLV
ncbi:endonuclease/exonuclease/phosphatase family protein [Algivirga pacifica]|uniref:Endonuclease/exonuclease/phosphatase family protein n=1 Tax=Algivirga pacifica TaxID=1162670 RepID=A0ABP9DIW8_9BACT